MSALLQYALDWEPVGMRGGAPLPSAPLLAYTGTSQSFPEGKKKGKDVSESAFHAWKSKNKKRNYVIQQRVLSFIQYHTLEHILMVRITPKSVDYASVSRSFNSFRSNALGGRVLDYFCAVEYGDKNGKLHYHLLLAVPWSVGHASFNHVALKEGRTKETNANKELREFWAFMREKLEKYGFHKGHQVVPVRGSGEQAAGYVTRYLCAVEGFRAVRDRGHRLYRTSSGFLSRYGNISIGFSWECSKDYRYRVGVFCHLRGYSDIGDAKKWLGFDFQRRLRDNIGRMWAGVELSGPFVPWHLRDAQIAYNQAAVRKHYAPPNYEIENPF